MKKLTIFVFALSVLFFGLGAASAQAATLKGWAWSETFGWISFNSADIAAAPPQTPCQSNCPSSLSETGLLSSASSFGYVFTPAKNGQITKISFFVPYVYGTNTYSVTLQRISDLQILASGSGVDAPYWQSTTLSTPVNVTAGVQYGVFVSGARLRNYYTAPFYVGSYGDITINYFVANGSPSYSAIAGLADVTFVPSGPSYSVSVDSSGNWSGYSWSEYLGWVSFNSSDVSVCGTPAHLDKSTGAVTGWARALVYGGTDGCVELSGTNHSSPSNGGSGGITYDSNSGVFKGFAWGGDTANHTGPGWIQFNPNISNPVVCLGTDCGYGSTVSGTCTAVTPNQNVAPNTSVTFQANPSNGSAPYHYNWNGSGYDAQSPTNRFTASYATSAVGPLVVIKDGNNLVSSNISCPAVSVLAPIGSSNLTIGRAISSATGNTLTAKQASPFALVWNLTVTSDYSCSPTIAPDPNNAGWNANWKNASLNSANNGDGTKTWSGNTGTTLQAGTVAVPVTPGIYQFGIRCTSSATPVPNPPQSANVTLKVNSSSVKEI